MFLKCRTVCTPCRVEQNKLARIAKRLSEHWPRPSDEVACNMAFRQWRGVRHDLAPSRLVATL